MIQPHGFVTLCFLIMFVVFEKQYMISSKPYELDSIVLVPNLLNSGSNVLMLITHFWLIIPLMNVYFDDILVTDNNSTLISTILTGLYLLLH